MSIREESLDRLIYKVNEMNSGLLNSENDNSHLTTSQCTDLSMLCFMLGSVVGDLKKSNANKSDIESAFEKVLNIEKRAQEIYNNECESCKYYKYKYICGDDWCFKEILEMFSDKNLRYYFNQYKAYTLTSEGFKIEPYVCFDDYDKMKKVLRKYIKEKKKKVFVSDWDAETLMRKYREFLNLINIEDVVEVADKHYKEIFFGIKRKVEKGENCNPVIIGIDGEQIT